MWTNGINAKYPDLKNKVFWEYVVRTGIVLLTCEYSCNSSTGGGRGKDSDRADDYRHLFLSSLFSVVLAVAVTDLELFISFTGSFCLSTMGIAFPAIVQTLVHWCNRGNNRLQFALLVFKNFILVVIALIAFTIGVVTTVTQFLNQDHQ